MKKNILISAATELELEYLISKAKTINNYKIIETSDEYIYLFVSGIGSAQTAYNLAKIFSKIKFQTAFQIGIAGSFKQEFLIGDLVKIKSDIFADLSFSNSDIAMHETIFNDFKSYPFSNSFLIPDICDFSEFNLPSVTAITVNSTTNSYPKAEFWISKYNPDVETMEGSAFYFATMSDKIPSLQIRAISNITYDNNNWNIPLALKNLNDFLNAKFNI